MNLSEYSNYDGLGLAQLVKNKGLSAADANTNLDGDFAGVPLLLKDIGATEKNRPQCSGSRLGSGYVAGHDSYLTRFFKQAGFNITGQPAISLPLANNEQDMPIGIQLVAGFGNEQLLPTAAPGTADPGWTGAHSCTSVKSFQFAIEFSTNDALYRTQR